MRWHSARNSARGGRVPLSQRTRQWFGARNRLLGLWFGVARCAWLVQGLPQLQLQRPAQVRPAATVAAIALQAPAKRRHPRWWEYESELKCRIALEALLRQMFRVLTLTPAQPHPA